MPIPTRRGLLLVALSCEVASASEISEDTSPKVVRVSGFTFLPFHVLSNVVFPTIRLYTKTRQKRKSSNEDFWIVFCLIDQQLFFVFFVKR
jgi:hypothetical protein